eukprot:gene22448-29563_t
MAVRRLEGMPGSVRFDSRAISAPKSQSVDVISHFSPQVLNRLVDGRKMKDILVDEYTADKDSGLVQAEAGQRGHMNEEAGQRGHMNVVRSHSVTSEDVRRIRNSRVPVLFVHGRHDIVAKPSYAEDLAHRLGAPIVMLASAHQINRESPKELHGQHGIVAKPSNAEDLARHLGAPIVMLASAHQINRESPKEVQHPLLSIFSFFSLRLLPYLHGQRDIVAKPSYSEDLAHRLGAPIAMLASAHQINRESPKEDLARHLGAPIVMLASAHQINRENPKEVAFHYANHLRWAESHEALHFSTAKEVEPSYNSRTNLVPLNVEADARGAPHGIYHDDDLHDLKPPGCCPCWV